MISCIPGTLIYRPGNRVLSVEIVNAKCFSEFSILPRLAFVRSSRQSSCWQPIRQQHMKPSFPAAVHKNSVSCVGSLKFYQNTARELSSLAPVQRAKATELVRLTSVLVNAAGIQQFFACACTKSQNRSHPFAACPTLPDALQPNATEPPAALQSHPFEQNFLRGLYGSCP